MTSAIRMAAAAFVLLSASFGACPANSAETGFDNSASALASNAPALQNTPAKKPAGTAPLILGVHPYRTPSELYARFTPLASYLGRRLGRPVIIEVSTNYASHVERVGMGSIDIAFLGPASYVLLVDRHGRQTIAGGVEVNHKRTFQGVIAVQEHGPIKRVSDLYGKRLAFGDINSTMGHIAPRAMLMEAGVPISSYRFLKNHDDVALGVLYGDFDAGAIKEDAFDEYRGRGLRELLRTPPIPEHLFVANRDMPAGLVKALREALTEADMEEDGKSALFAIDHEITAIVPARDAEYDNLRRMVRLLVAAGAIWE